MPCRWERPRGPVLTLCSSWQRPSSQPCYDKHLQELAARQREKRQVRDDHVMSTSCPGLVSPLFYKDPSCLSNRFSERTRLFRGLLFWNNKKRHSAVSLMVFLRFLSCTWGTSACNLWGPWAEMCVCFSSLQGCCTDLWTFLRWCFWRFFTWWWRRLKPVPGSCVCEWIYLLNLHLKKEKEKKKNKKKEKSNFGPFLTPPGLDSCFRIGPRCISDYNQRYGAEPTVVSLWEDATCARLVQVPSSAASLCWVIDVLASSFIQKKTFHSPSSGAGWTESSGPKRALSLRSLMSDVPEMIYLFSSCFWLFTLLHQ